MKKKLTIVVEQGEDGYLIAEVVGLPGCHTQARNYEELLSNIREVISLYAEEFPQEIKERFLGIDQIEIEV